MGKLSAADTSYMISVHDDPKVAGGLRFTFVPAGGNTAQPLAEYILSVSGHDASVKLRWIASPAQEETRAELESIARARVGERYLWIEKLNKLVDKVKSWATELDWSTKTIEKKMEDAEVGDHLAPALLIQNGPVRLFLEPVSRVAPGTGGVVDLYLMPTYDDIASLYWYDDRWNVHYVFRGQGPVAKVLETAAMPLTKATIQKVFRGMSADAE